MARSSGNFCRFSSTISPIVKIGEVYGQHQQIFFLVSEEIQFCPLCVGVDICFLLVKLTLITVSLFIRVCKLSDCRMRFDSFQLDY